MEAGLTEPALDELCETWFREGDFLLLEHEQGSARWVVGNPPYVRLEQSGSSGEAYRRRWSTMTGRADIYVGFFQAGVELLCEGGVISYLCADRWMHNQYGKSLRRWVAETTSVDLILELHNANVFMETVSAYPAITVFTRGRSDAPSILAVANDKFDSNVGEELRSWLADSTGVLNVGGVRASRLTTHALGAEPWPSTTPELMVRIARLESRLPQLEYTGARVRVGLATGADKVYIVSSPPAGVEQSRLQRAVGPSDIVDGQIHWAGRCFVSPWENGDLVNLDDYPGLAAYLNDNAKTLKDRYVAKKHPDTWWRTIDRPLPGRFEQPKLVVADIKDRIEPVLDISGAWPMHSTYYITSEVWPLEALGGYLLSDIAETFVRAYSVKMASGHLRISGQYLRRIRIPEWSDVSLEIRAELVRAFTLRDRVLATETVESLLSPY